MNTGLPMKFGMFLDWRGEMKRQAELEYLLDKRDKLYEQAYKEINEDDPTQIEIDIIHEKIWEILNDGLRS